MVDRTIRICDDPLQKEESEWLADRRRTFALDGRTYEIDLCEEDSAHLEELLDPYLKVARRIVGAKGVGIPSPASSRTLDYQAIRAWAAQNKIHVSPRGRIPHTVLNAYQEAHG